MWRRVLVVVSLLALGVICSLQTSEAAAEGRQCTSRSATYEIGYGDLWLCGWDRIRGTSTYTFFAKEGEAIIIQASEVLLGQGLPCIDLSGPKAIPVCATKKDPVARIKTTIATGEEGYYTINIQEVGGDSGQNMTYALALERVSDPPSPNAVPLPFDTPIIDALYTDGDVDLYEVTIEAGSEIRVEVLKRDSLGTPCINIFDAQGDETAYSCGRDSAEIVSTIVDKGNYTIMVSDDRSADSMKYSVVLECLSGPCIDPPPPLNLSFILSLQERPVTEADCFTVKFYKTGTNIEFTDAEFTACADPSGKLSQEVSLESGTYDILFKLPGYLSQLLTNVAINGDATIISPMHFFFGDLDGDESIGRTDVQALFSVWSTSDHAADYNGDKTVNSVDYSKLNENWSLTGPTEVNEQEPPGVP